MKTLFKMFLTFARIGGFTFGGGYAMLPMLQREVVEKYKWATSDELLDYYAIGQCTPGVIAVNTATFIGYKLKGIPGAIFATLGVVTPSMIIIGIIAAFISNFRDLEVVQWAFSGIRAAVVALILSAVIKIGKKSIVDIFTVLIFLLTAVLSFVIDVSPVVFIVVAAAAGLVINLTGLRKVKEDKDE